MPECKSCNQIWQQRYNEAVRRFDKSLNKAITVMLIAIVISFVCIIATISIAIRTQKFIAQFEYVEETNVEIEQNEGINAAIVGDESEVTIYGAENQDHEKEILAQEAANKSNRT